MDPNPNTPQTPTPPPEAPTPMMTPQQTPPPVQPPAQFQPPAPLPPNPNNKKTRTLIIIISLIVVLIGLAVAGFFVAQGLINNNDEKKVDNKSTDVDTKKDKKKVATSQCLTDADVGKYRTGTTARSTFEIEDYFFEENGADFSYPEVSNENSAKLATFVKDNKSKRFTLEIQGSVYRDYNTEEGNALSQKRAEAVKSSLVSAGVPASKIEILAPKTFEYGQTELSGGDNSPYQNATVSVKADDSCIY